MISQISYYVVGGIVLFILLNFVLLVGLSPKAVSEIKSYASKVKSTKSVSFGGGMTELLEKISTSRDRDTLETLVERLKVEAKKAASGSGEQADHARTVVIWLDSFDIDRHIADIKASGESSQIRYDTVYKNFKLLIPSQD
ncbi:MAG: hypothetical protein ACRCY4_05360 [Brevinema sp.]